MAIDPRPVYEYDQVITIRDLIAIRNGYVYQYGLLPWYKAYKKWMFRVGIGVCSELMHWLSTGKNGRTEKETLL
jgi:hypothetical protein